MRRKSFSAPAFAVRCSVPVLGLLALALPAAAQATADCSAPGEFNRFDRPLGRVAQRLASGQTVTIVAVGSSSTAGAGATSSAASYPSRLEVELKQHFPAASIRVLNRGVGGEEAADMIARFEPAVLSEQPDLVLWQLGTNSVLRDKSLKISSSLIHHGIDQLKASGADVVLIDPQFAPKVLAKADATGMVDLIGATAKEANVGLFHRFAVMRHWSENERIPFTAFLSPDGLHMNDWSYACLAKLLGVAIAEAATRTTAVARMPAGANRPAGGVTKASGPQR